jgi:hypothetical protein
MIVSDKYKYVFIQNAMTASSVTGKELRNNHDGKDFLWKHAKYEDFLKVATKEQKEYLVIGTIRNPLDCLVTKYCRLVNDPILSRLKNDIKAAKKKGFSLTVLSKLIYVTLRRIKFRVFKFSFKSYVKSELSKIKPDSKKMSFVLWDTENLDFILKYESIDDDFNRLLKTINSEKITTIPRGRKTRNKKPFLSYYDEASIKIVKNKMSNVMKKLGYDFPKEWNYEEKN